MNKSIITGITSILLSGMIICQGQSAYIKGSAKGAEGKLITVNQFDDYVSGKEVCLAATVIDSNGKFELTVPLKGTSYAWFTIDYYHGEMYLDPGTHHVFELRELVFNEKTDRINTNLEPLIIRVVPDSTDQLNTAIQRFNIITNRFLAGHLIDLAERRLKKPLDSLRLHCDSLFAELNIRYFKDYMRYRFACLYLMNAQTSSQRLFDAYINDQPVLHDHIEYMSFFSDYFGNCFLNVESPVGLNEVRRVVNEEVSWPALLDSVGDNPKLLNEVVRELVLLHTLKDLYATPGFKRENILTILEQAQEQTKFEAHRRMASNLIEILTRYTEGTPAPTFALPDAGNDTISPGNYPNKYIYLHFFTTWNVASLEEMEVMRALYPKYSQNFQFISICCDREYMKMFHFSREKKYPWPVVHFNNDYTLLRAYNVVTYPCFILLDPQGRYLANPAESPSLGIEKRLKKVLGAE